MEWSDEGEGWIFPWFKVSILKGRNEICFGGWDSILK